MKSKLFIICMLLTIVCSVSFVSAADASNDTGIIQSDNSVVLTDSPTASFDKLQDEINNAKPESTLYLNKSYTKTSWKNIIQLHKSLTIDGRGHTLDCGNNAQRVAFYSKEGDITLKNLKFINANNIQGGNGGAILITGSAKYTIINCTFINNAADNRGGAIYNNVEDNTLTIINSSFISNKASNDEGGAIYSKGNLEIKNSYFEGNTAKVDGGAIYAERDADISSTVFKSNKATGAIVHRCFGGAICAKKDLFADYCNFTDNFADNYGGAIYGYMTVLIENSLFSKNSAKEGGAVYKKGSESMVVDGSVFMDNKATSSKGGAIYSNKWISIGNSSFTANTASSDGGAIYSDYIQFESASSFINNSADGHGGAVYTSKIGGTSKDLCFNSNRATSDFGGALYINNDCGDVWFYNSTFVKNYANAGDGGAVFSDSSGTVIRLVNCNFTENYANGGVAKRYGGAVCSKGDVYVVNSSFANNWAENSGGAIYGYGKVYLSDNSCFTNNYVKKDYGGAVYCDVLGSADNCAFVSNRGREGGAIYANSKSTTTISKSYFASNYCNDRGGAVYFDSRYGDLYLSENAFVGNDAGGQGKDVFNSGEYKSIGGNWWGTNSPSFDNEKLMEYKTFGSNKKHSDDSYNTVNVNCISNPGYMFIPITFNVTFTKNTPSYLLKTVTYSSDSEGNFSIGKMGSNYILIDYVPLSSNKTHQITINVSSQSFKFTFPINYISVFAGNLTKTQGDSKLYSATFKDASGKNLPKGSEVTFEMDGKTYKGKVSDMGIASCDEVSSLMPGVYTIKAINPLTNESFTNKITVLTRNLTYNINDTFIMKFPNANGTNLSVTFKIADKYFKSNVSDGIAFCRLDVAPGDYAMEVLYNNSVIQTVNIKILNSYSESLLKVKGNNYAALIPIYNNETFIRTGNVLYSEIGENTRRYIFPTGDGAIIYNVTVSNNDEFANALRKIASKDFLVDVIIINLKPNTYKISENFYRDQEWYYLMHLTYGSLFINGNGAVIDDEYHHNFITAEKDTRVSIDNLTFKQFYRVFVNNGNVYCSNCQFIKNDARFWATKTPGSVIYNKHVATFQDCIFDDNQNDNSGSTFNPELQASFYLESQSLTNFVKCQFRNKEHDTVHALDGSMVVLYDDDKNNYNQLTADMRNNFESGSCLDYRPVSSFNINKTGTYTYNDLTRLASDINNQYHADNASAFIINLDKGTYSISASDFEKIASPYDFRTYNSKHTFFTKPGDKESTYITHRYLIEVGSRPVVIDGHGSTISLTDSNENSDNHFAFVPYHSTLTLINMTISGFNTAVVNYGQLIIINCTFDGNKIHYIYQKEESENGGAIRNYASVFCYNTTFKNNRATNGAAYFSKGSSALGQFYNCTFSKNTLLSNLAWKTGDENTLFLDGNSVAKIIKCSGISQSNIKKEKNGLAIFKESLKENILNYKVDSLASLIKLSKIANDNEEYDLINVTFEKGDYPLLPDSKTLFELNYGQLILSANGARIYVSSPKSNDETQFLKTDSRSSVTIIGLTLEGFNIAIDNSGGLNIFNSTFNNNRVDYVKKSDYGGAIVNGESGSITIFNSSFSGNYAKYGGAIYNTGTVQIIISNFRDNVGYNSKSNVDIYNHKSSSSIISVKNQPVVVDNFPMAAWRQDLLEAGITLAITAVTAGVTWGISAAGVAAAHFINTLVGAGIGAVGGLAHGFIYSNDNHDYSEFADKLIHGISTGINAVAFGEAINEYVTEGRIIPIHEKTAAEIQQMAVERVFDEFTSRNLDFIKDWISAEVNDDYDSIFWYSFFKDWAN